MTISREALVLIGIATADLISTVVLVKCGAACEGNPIMAYVLEQSIFAFIALKVLLSALPVSFLEYARRTHPRMATIGMRTAIACYLTSYLAVMAPQIGVVMTYQAAMQAAAMPSPLAYQSFGDRALRVVGTVSAPDRNIYSPGR